MTWLAATPLIFVALFWALVFAGTWSGARKQKWVLKIAAVLPDAGVLPKVSVVIPARNEERNLEACLDAVRALEWPDLEIVLLDDRSTDGTAAIARASAAADRRVILPASVDPPAGWLGKSWALHQAQAVAKGEWLLFLDADVQVHPRALAQAFRWVKANGAQMLSGYGYLRLETFWENVVMPVLGGMIVGANPLDEVNDPKHERVVCNGQFILISRAAYGAIGGHEAVKGAIIDDMALAGEAKKKNIAYRMIFCRELFRTRMYTTFGEIWRGWTKNLYAGVGYRPGLALGVVGFILVTAVLPPVAVVARVLMLLHAGGPGWLLDPVFASAFAATVLMFAYRIYASRIFDHDWRWFWSHPLGALVSAGIFFNSAWKGLTGRTVEWKGRQYGASGPSGTAGTTG